MTNQTLETIKSRRSVRAFLPRQITPEERDAVVGAGQYAPHGSEQEACHFTVIQNAGLLEIINRLAKEAAARSGLPWLAALGEDAGFHCLYGAPTLVFVSAQEGVTAAADTAAATQNLLLAAQSLGLGSCWAYFPTQAFLSPEGADLRQTLRMPDGYTAVMSVLLGYPAQAPGQAPPRQSGRITLIP